VSSHGAPDLDTLVAELSDDAEERSLMRGALDLMAYAAEPVEPQPGLKSRILRRLSEPAPAARFEANGFFFARAAQLEWQELAPGIRVKWLYAEPGTGVRTGLIEMGPSLPFPEHPHPEVEDLYLISGEAWVGDIPMRAGDYCRSPAGTAHNDIRSGPSGAHAIVVSR
jgi:hypothetical protein